MKRSRWATGFLVFVIALAESAPGALAETNIYLYDPEVASIIDLESYLADGTVQQADGQGFPRYVDRGPAPPEYGTIAISARGFEQLGLSGAKIDGVIFVNHGKHLKAQMKALVLWVIRIPNAPARTVSEFQKDLTLSMWVDWNQDTVWKEDERMTQKSLNVAGKFPTTKSDIYVYYLASFTVPDVTKTMMSNLKYGGPGSAKEVRHMWVRATLSYDDPDNSPDGAQLFGDMEDYRIAYHVKARSDPDDGDDDDDDD